ncbi:protein PRR14L isoform X2 [Tympanuchus pallidicinctus]|uniref:protein PRR14L isoform X2 n=1 Tax=Tympanuchus pallidicinctus TaxID=109042 RepID=UPI002286D7EF|nr:protein PRR14L isoform X2 [Tympanuchus pallidicinctus]
MLSSGVECLLDSSACTGTEDLHEGLSIPAGLMAVSEPGAGLDAEPDVSTPELAHSSELSSEHHRTLEENGFGEEAVHVDDVVREAHWEPAEPLTKELLHNGGAEKDEENKQTRRKQDCSCGEYQQGDKEEDPHLNKHEVNSSASCCAKGENQANVQVTAETLPKLTEEAQGMKADGTRIFSKAGYQNGSVSKGLLPESDECPNIDTVMARAGVSETTRLDFIEPLKVMDVESTTEHSQEISEYNELKAHADISLRTGSNVVSVLETTEEKLPRQNLVNEFNTSLGNCHTYRHNEENNTCDLCTVFPRRHNEPVRLSSVGSCRMLSIKSSEVMCSVLESVCYLDFRNVSLDNNSTAIHGIINETSKKHLPESMTSQTNYGHRTGFVKNCTSKSMPVEHLSLLSKKELSSDKTGDVETNDSTSKSYISEFEEAAEIQREIAVGGNVEARESADVEHCHPSVFNSIAPSSEEFSKEKLETIPSKASKWKKDQLQFSVSDLCKDDLKESVLLKETNSTASHETIQTDVGIYKAYSKISFPTRHDCQDVSAKLEDDSPEVQLFEQESQSNALEFSDKETNLIYTLNVILPPLAQKSREPHCDECPFCTANEAASKDKDNLSGKELFGSSGTTEEQVAEFVLHKDKFTSSINPKTSDEFSMTGNISQKNKKSSEGKVESVENEHSNTWKCSNRTLKDQHTASTTSSILTSSTPVGDAVLNSNFFKADIEMKIENDSLEGEVSVGCNSKKTITFLEECCPLSYRSLPCQDDWGNRCVALHGINDISTEKSMFCLTYDTEEPPAILVGDEISNKSMKSEKVKQFDLCKLTDCSEIICDKDEAEKQFSMCAVHTHEFDKIRTVSSPKVPEGNWTSETGKQLLVRNLNKKSCVHNFEFCNSPLLLKMRELGTSGKKGMSSLTASSSEYSFSICGACPLLNNMNMQTRHAIQTEMTVSAMENQFLAHQSEFCGLVHGRKQHVESLSKEPNTGLQYIATSAEEAKLSISSSQHEQILLKKGDDLTLLGHEHVREDGFQRTLKENAVDFESSSGLTNADCSRCIGFVSDVIQEKMTEVKESENGCGRADKGTHEESLPDSKSQYSQHALSIKSVKDKVELVISRNARKRSLAKMKWLTGDQAVNVSFLPSSSIHGSLFYKPEMCVPSEMENKNLKIKSVSDNSCSQLMLEPGKENDANKGVGPSCFVKFNIQDSSNETHEDSETPSAPNLANSLPQKEKLFVSSENTDIGNSDSSSDEICWKGSSVTKPFSVTMYIKREASNTEIPSLEDEKAASSLKGAGSLSVCACNKERQRNERHGVLTAKVMDVTLPKSADFGEKLKNARTEEKMEREVSHKKQLPIHSLLDGEDCLWASIEGLKESSSKTITLSTENYEKSFEEIPRPDLNSLQSLSKERNATKLTSSTDTSLLSEAVQDCQTADASDTETSPEFKYNEMNVLSNGCKESLPNYAVQCEVCVPYKLNAQSKDNAKEITGCQDTVAAHSVSVENETSNSVRRDEVEKCQARKRKKKCEGVKVHGSDKAKQEKKAAYKVKSKVAVHPSVLYSSELLCSSSNELVMSKNTKFESPSKEAFAVRSRENKLCSTLQEIKRPKITTDTISSCFLKTQDSEIENLNLKAGCNGILGAFRTRNKLRGPLPLKIQPGRTCKKVPTSYQLETARKIKKSKSSTVLEPPSEMPPKQENTVLKSLYFASKSPTVKKEIAMRFVHMPRQKAKRCSLLSSLKFRKCTKEPALLSKLSALASKLLVPATSIHCLESLPYSSEILPAAARHSQRRSKNLLEAFSCINRNLHSRWADSWCTKMFSFQSLALYSRRSTKIPSLDSSNNSPSSFLDTPVFPISFHIKLDSSPVTDLTWTTSQHSVHHKLVLEEMPAPPSTWTFLLSQSCSGAAAIKEDSSQDHKLHSPLSVTTPGVVALHPDHGRNAIAERTGSCSMLGLHTVLALSSPGCYRIWTRRRNLTSHIPTIQRLFISQFTQGLKGGSNVSDDLVSSLPYSLGRALSMWSQHGPSARPSEITPLHSSHCKWQPSVGIENSYAVLPHLPVQGMEVPQTAGHEICLEPPFPLPLPKSCMLSEALPPMLPEPELQVHAPDAADSSTPDCFRSQDDTELKKTEPEERPKKVSQIRIRKTVPRLDHNLTPMGLPKPKRLKKKEFSLEEIYTNKNYKSPPPARSLETIFEEPKEKNGHLISVSQQKRKRILEFQDFTVPRKRKARGKIKAVGSFTRAKKAAPQSAELDALLSQKLMDLEEFFAKEDEQLLSSSTGGSHELKMVQ